MSEAFKVALAILGSIGSAGFIIFALSSWLGKVWANRILEADRAKYVAAIEALKHRYTVDAKMREVRALAVSNDIKEAAKEIVPALGEAHREAFAFTHMASMENMSDRFYQAMIPEEARSSASAVHKYNLTVQKYRIFLPQEIYDNLIRCHSQISSLRQEAEDHVLPEGVSAQVRKSVPRNPKEIMEDFYAFCDQEESVVNELRALIGIVNPSNSTGLDEGKDV